VAVAAPGAISAREEAALAEALAEVEEVSADSAVVVLEGVVLVVPGRKNSKFQAPSASWRTKQIQKLKSKIGFGFNEFFFVVLRV
jgi:hypothetical protein